LVQNRDKGRRTSSWYRTELREEGLALGTEQRLQNRDKGRRGEGRTISRYRTEIRGEGLALGTEQI
jgi:hypothetical protein